MIGALGCELAALGVLRPAIIKGVLALFILYRAHFRERSPIAIREPQGSVPGNPLLAESVYLTKYIERMGRGPVT